MQRCCPGSARDCSLDDFFARLTTSSPLVSCYAHSPARSRSAPSHSLLHQFTDGATPGGKIGAFNGLLNVATDQHQLAAVMAHEVGHVLANHSNERASQSTIRNVGLFAAQVLGASDTTLQAIDIGTHHGLFLPFNRTQESEARPLACS